MRPLRDKEASWEECRVRQPMQGGAGDPVAPAVCLQTPGILLVVRVTMATRQDFARAPKAVLDSTGAQVY